MKVCGTWCIRPAIRAYIRLFGYRIKRVTALPDGGVIYLFEDACGRWGRAAPAFRYASGEQAYFITWEV